jgi:hypothetical protein
MELDLVLVLPVYNEEDCIVAVMREWTTMLSHLGIRYQMIVLNDGSKDRTAARLAEFSGDSHVQVIDKANAGHGPTVLQGYRLAVDRAIWAFQCDSDNEMPADHFPELWARREHYDALFGTRTDRVQTLPRKIVSAASRMTVRILFGPGVVDVNTPYRLMRCSVLKQIIEQIRGLRQGRRADLEPSRAAPTAADRRVDDAMETMQVCGQSVLADAFMPAASRSAADRAGDGGTEERRLTLSAGAAMPLQMRREACCVRGWRRPITGGCRDWLPPQNGFFRTTRR